MDLREILSCVTLGLATSLSAGILYSVLDLSRKPYEIVSKGINAKPAPILVNKHAVLINATRESQRHHNNIHLVYTTLERSNYKR